MVGQQDDFPVLVLVPYHHFTQDVRASFLGIAAAEPNQFIGQDIAVGRNNAFFDDGIIGIVFQTGDKKDLVFRPIGKQLIIIIPRSMATMENGASGIWRAMATSCFFPLVIWANVGR